MAKKAKTEKKTLSPFDIINTILRGDEEEFSKISEKDLANNAFIINDRFSIHYPMEAALLNHYKINQTQLVHVWFYFCKKIGLRGFQKWMTVPGKAKSQETKKKTNSLSNKSIKDYADAKNYSIKDIEFALSLYPDQMKQEILDYEKHLEELEKFKKDSLKSISEKNNDEEEYSLTLDAEHTEAIF